MAKFKNNLGGIAKIMEGGFFDKDFISQGLNLGNVIEYFKRSPYFNESEEGVTYELSLAQPHGSAPLHGSNIAKPEHRLISIDKGLVVIDKKDAEKNIIGKFIVSDGTVLPAPDLFEIATARIASSLAHLQQAVRNVNNVFNWDVEKGFTKKIAEGETETKYVFKASELKDLHAEAGDEFKLQSALLDALLTEIGIPSS